MGLEAKTTARFGRKKYQGKLHLDSTSLDFKAGDFSWAVELDAAIVARARKELLIVEKGNEIASFEIGPASAKWVEKILNPPNRLKKLGVKPKQIIWKSTGFSNAFASELRQHGVTFTRQIERCELAFWAVTSRDQLIEFDELADRLGEGINIWIVWTKGSKAIGQTDVMEAAKRLGFGPSKTAAFDVGRSSMRFAKKK